MADKPAIRGSDFGETTIQITVEDDIVAARGTAREAAKVLGFGVVDQSRIATAVSELARNVVRYATDGRGEVVVRALGGTGTGTGIEIIVRDQGPGIADTEQAMAEGFTSGSGMGMGLPGTRRLMDEMLLESTPGHGTTVTIRKWRR